MVIREIRRTNSMQENPKRENYTLMTNFEVSEELHRLIVEENEKEI